MKTSRILIVVILVLLAYILGAKYGFFDNETPTAHNHTHSRGLVKDEPISQPQIFSNIEEATVNLFEKASPSVTFINTSTIQQNRWTRNEMEVPKGSGSGFVWDDNGHIVTNFHVIQNAQQYTVTLWDQSVWPARRVGVEPNKDLAVLKIEAPKKLLRPIPTGDSRSLRVGQSVYAIGNPFGLDQSLTTGIISALGREITSVSGLPIRDVIQSDAAINPGNSGGPLLDSYGRLIGVNTAIYSPSGASAGIGFSIPVDVVEWVVPDLIAYGKVKRPLLGVELMPQNYTDRLQVSGAMIMSTSDGGAAEKAKLRETTRGRNGEIIYGDLITQIDDTPIRSNTDLILGLEKYQIGDTIKVHFVRDNEEDSIDLVLGSSF